MHCLFSCARLSVLIWLGLHSLLPLRVTAAITTAASTSAGRFGPDGAIDGNRFSLESGAAWKGRAGEKSWWWQVQFSKARDVGAILHVFGDHAFVFRDAPRAYVWQTSDDGQRWDDLAETAVTNEMRLFRLHRLTNARQVHFLRLNISAVTGEFPTVREVELFSNPRATVSFPDWIAAVNTTHDATLPGHGQEFIPLAKSCDEGRRLEAQQIWINDFKEEFLNAEPFPLCAFLSGNFKDWCEVNREWWRGTQEILRYRNLPIWASCGGAQGLAIVAETGVDKPWDCPHCRDPQNPKTPIYSHIGHTSQRPCGDYSACIFERGPHWVRSMTDDPVFKNLPREFQVIESHCGQIEWPPTGWSLIATAGQGTRTATQCLRMNNHYIYAAQFHIEMAGTAETSKQIMKNFLSLAKAWGGYHAELRTPR
jgi:hypothetical protein